MNQQSFVDLLTRYQAGQATEAEQQQVEQWYHTLGDQQLQGLSASELEQMQHKVWNNLHSNTHPIVKLNPYWKKIAIAASIAVAFLIGGLYLAQYNPAEQAFLNEDSALEMLSASNSTSHPIQITLSDNSIVTLDPQAKITYPKIFAAYKRMVYLKGNAFFSVSKNHRKPFYVYNQKLVVKVLGTSFYVKGANQEQAQVSVRTGKVQVNENCRQAPFSLSKTEMAKPILLTPNQKGVFANHKLDKTLVEKPIPLAVAYHLPNLTKWNFKEAQLGTIFKTLTEAYGIEIKAEHEPLLSYTFTGDLSNKGLYEQLALICGSISGKYTINGTSILVSNTN